jgi:hypothetical protein
MCQGTVHVELWIDPDSEPISGWVAAGDREREEFGGWVELTAVIESARRTLVHADQPSAKAC